MRVGIAYIYRVSRGFNAYVLLPGDEACQHLTDFANRPHAARELHALAGGIISIVPDEEDFWEYVEVRLSPKRKRAGGGFKPISPRISRAIPEHLSLLNAACRNLKTETEPEILPYWQEHKEEQLAWFGLHGIDLIHEPSGYRLAFPMPDEYDTVQDDRYYTQEVLNNSRETRLLNAYESRRRVS